MYRKTLIINQALPAGWGPPVPAPCAVIQRDHPSRFRRKKDYNGPTARSFNKNYKRMPKDF